MDKRMIVVVLSVVALLIVACASQQEGASKGTLAGEATKLSASAPTIPASFTGRIYEKCETLGDATGVSPDPLKGGSTLIKYQEYYKGNKQGGVKQEVLSEECLTETTLLEYFCGMIVPGASNNLGNVVLYEERIDCSLLGLKCVQYRPLSIPGGIQGYESVGGAACT